jgi:carboxymethylenebutenolidase
MVGRREFIHGWWVLAFTASLDGQVEIPSEFDTSLESIAVAFHGASGMTLGYSTQPKSRGPHAGAVLLHDVAGLTNGVRGAARNLATSGYAVVAPDFLSPQGGVASFRGVDADVRRAVTATSAAAVKPQAVAALGYVKSHGGSAGRGAVLVGFGWGATQAILFAAGRTDVAACVAFSPDMKQALPALAKTSAPVLIIAAADEADPAAVRAPHAVKAFAGTARGFYDPGETKIYKPEAAKQAWTAAVAHLDAHAKSSSRSGA